MRYSLHKFQCIPDESLGKLAAAGITDSDTLLSRAATPKQRKVLAEMTQIPINDLTLWCGVADLLRVKGIGIAYANLFVHSGCAANVQQLILGLKIEKDTLNPLFVR